MWIDRSGSPTQLQRIAPQLEEAFRATAVTGIEACVFGLGEAHSWAEPCKRFTWGEKPSSGPSKPTTQKMPIEAIFRESRDKILDQSKQRDDANQQSRIAQYNTAVNQQLAAFSRYLLERPVSVPPCTRFEDMRVRLIGQQRELNLIITDGLMDCPKSARKQKLPLSPPGRTIILLVPSKKDANARDSEEQRFTLRTEAMGELFPWATCVPVFAIEKLPNLLDGSLQGLTVETVTSSAATERNTETPKAAPQHRADNATNGPRPRSPMAGTETTDKVEIAVRNMLTDIHARHVRPSIGPYDGECFTDQMLQQMISTQEHRAIAIAEKDTSAFKDVVVKLRGLGVEQQHLVLRFARSFRSHRSWAELGGDPTPDGQTTAGVRAELLLSQAVTDILQEMLK